MISYQRVLVAAIWGFMASLSMGFAQDRSAASLPPGVRAVWDLGKASREATPTRERVCLNGLWRWQPARNLTDSPPTGQWGYFKVPGPWPGITDYMQKDSQTVHRHPDWEGEKLGGLTMAWYEREITIPGEWAGRRITLHAEYLNSYAVVYVDGKKAGEMRFPWGDVDLTPVCRPGGKHTLSAVVMAMPLKGVILSYTDTASAREVKGSVARRGLCGDVYLTSAPQGARIAEVNIATSVRNGEITIGAALEDLAGDARYTLHAQITEKGRTVKEFSGRAFTAADLQAGRSAVTEKWMPEKLWDIHTPQNQYILTLSLRGADSKVLDTGHPLPFGFRDLWIKGRDFYLNGSRLFLSAVPLDNAQVGAALATYESACETMERLKGFGINFVYTHNYDCEPGSHLSFAEILRAADDTGMLVALTQPHFSHYDWKAPDADQNNGYARHAEFYAHVARNHPSVVFYAMSHNATGYNEDMNPDQIDGKGEPRDQWALNNSRLALRAEVIVNRLDPGRIVYHHSSGNLSSMHTVNFYANFAPIQEQSDWFQHWATEGVKPAFTCEYSVPFTWDWTMYRGWYKGQREFGSAKVPWEFCLAEWNSQFLGDQAFRISELEKANLRWETRQFRAGNLWHRWDYPGDVGSSRFDERFPVLAMYLNDNWRAFRTWGLSANSPWEYGHYWKLRDGVDRRRKELKVDWENLQRPGLSPDYLGERFERMDIAFERSDWVPTVAAQALLRNNQPLLAYIGGKEAAFTSKDHNFHPGDTIEKQIILINNSRQTVKCVCEWSFPPTQTPTGAKEIAVATGDQSRVPVRVDLPPTLAPGQYELSMTVRFSTGETQNDSFVVHVLPRPAIPLTSAKIALFDPKGETGKWLGGLGIVCQRVDANADLRAYDILVVGKAALTVEGPAPAVAQVRDGLKVVLFEQTSDVLEKRFGFRVEEYGLRRVFKRVSDHPILAGLTAEHLRDWQGEATILPPRLDYEMRPRYGPTVKWCDIPVTRLWRCGNRGNVASVLIEKPARGDFMPILDGGYSLQYSPLLEYHEGKGMMLFCQLDVTGRTATDAAAELLARNILQYVSAWKPLPVRKAVYAGDPSGKKHLESAGIAVTAYDGETLSPDQVLVMGPLAGEALAPHAAAVGDWLKGGGHLLAIGLGAREANSILPTRITTKNAEYISAYFEPFGGDSPFAGVGPADVHNRDPRELPLITSGATIVGDGVLGQARTSNVVFCQLAPWQFDYSRQYNLKRTYRRTAFLVTRLLANMGVGGTTPILARFSSPVTSANPEKRWFDGLYLDQPEEWDDPYRFFRW